MKRQIGSLLYNKLNVFQIFGANTGVGKTVASTALVRQLAAEENESVQYLKPVQTGSVTTADVTHLRRFTTKNVRSKTIFNWDAPVSPHLAARYDAQTTDDNNILQTVHDGLAVAAADGFKWALVETAGGVLSPGPSGTLQADLYRPLRLPVLLVGDSRLGGIGSTVSAWESLRIRGYDVDGLILFRDEIYENHDYLQKHFHNRDSKLPIALLEQPPTQSPDEALDSFNMMRYYEKQNRQGSMEEFKYSIEQNLETRRERLTSLPNRAHQVIWHPFLQHTERRPENIMAIDSAYGDYFQTVAATQTNPNESMLKPAFDGSASWWTQGLGHGNPELALTAAHAAGRYGHVMFANAAHEPAVALAERMLIGESAARTPESANPKPTRAFYSDNGSTAMEVAVKMALKASSKRYGWVPSDKVEVIGLKDSYHGDTIGAMDLSEGNIYNEKVEWYSGRGHWLDYPRVICKAGKWAVIPPRGAEHAYGEAQAFDNLSDVFDFDARKPKQIVYENIITKLLRQLEEQGHKLGALVLEPVILGAGGMNFVDPLFQRSLVEAAQKVGTPKQNADSMDWQGMPVIADEVFTGVYRLGRFSSSEMIPIRPDITVHAKLLTGGVIPLSLTLASEAIYSAFLSDDKSDALLHGHSYTAHAIGCEVALKALDEYQDFDSTLTVPEKSSLGKWLPYKTDWGVSHGSTGNERPFWSMWSREFVHGMSHREDVEGLFALGSVMAITMKDPGGGGYASTASLKVRDRLLEGMPEFNQAVHCRVLGNVLYFMASLTTTPETISAIQTQIENALP